MTKLLFIQASPRGAVSKSIKIAETYLARLAAHNPDLEIDRLELWTADLPAFDGNKAAAKMNVFTGQAQEGATRTVWDEITEIAARFTSADRYLFAVPMWNGGVPYRLKHYIDLIHQPGFTFGLTPENGYFGLLEGKQATVVLTSGAYAPQFPSPAFGTDHHSTYIRDWLTQAGVTDIDELRFQPTLLTADPAGDLARVEAAAAALADRHSAI